MAGWKVAAAGWKKAGGGGSELAVAARSEVVAHKEKP